jgi:hypothetical protein
VEAVLSGSDSTQIPNLLVGYGASVNFNYGEVLALVATSGNLHLLNTLIGRDPTKDTMQRAFEAANQTIVESSMKTDVCKCLLASGLVPVASITSAMAREIVVGNRDLPLMSLLLKADATLELDALLKSQFEHETARV